MFSKYKRQSATAKPVTTAQPKAAPAPEAQPKAPAPAAATLRKPAARTKAEAAPADKERKRKERMGEIKIQLHRELLENLNLAALERAS
ncbi:MAG: CpaF family protein, partial [Phaeobacter italicus]